MLSSIINEKFWEERERERERKWVVVRDTKVAPVPNLIKRYSMKAHGGVDLYIH
jgi:hypothetical protein